MEQTELKILGSFWGGEVDREKLVAGILRPYFNVCLKEDFVL